MSFQKTSYAYKTPCIQVYSKFFFLNQQNLFALLVPLPHQSINQPIQSINKLINPLTPYKEGEEDVTEAWETVTEEREKWVRLVHHLESLTLLSNAVGQKAMRTLPPIPYTVCEEGEEEEEEGGLVHVGDMHVHLLHKGEGIIVYGLVCSFGGERWIPIYNLHVYIILLFN